eukprot:m.240121 g.240121  ORF g.240121 m.240121 type:complete len:87 (-) comp26273_c0_seq1:254-514(-)
MVRRSVRFITSPSRPDFLTRSLTSATSHFEYKLARAAHTVRTCPFEEARTSECACAMYDGPVGPSSAGQSKVNQPQFRYPDSNLSY